MPSFLISLASAIGTGQALAALVIEEPNVSEQVRKLAEKFAAEAEAALGQVKVGG